MMVVPKLARITRIRPVTLRTSGTLFPIEPRPFQRQLVAAPSLQRIDLIPPFTVIHLPLADELLLLQLRKHAVGNEWMPIEARLDQRAPGGDPKDTQHPEHPLLAVLTRNPLSRPAVSAASKVLSPFITQHPDPGISRWIESGRAGN